MMVEWMNVSVNTANIKERIDALLDWLIELKYRFYILDADAPKNCKI